MQYRQDFGEILPLNTVSKGWTEAIQTYMNVEQLFQCPQENNEGSFQRNESGYSDYFFNTHLNGLELAKLQTEPANIVLAGEGNDGIDLADARYNRRNFPASWRAKTDSPLRRHKGASNVLFLDGHVKSYSPERAVELKFVPEMRAR